MKLTLVSMSASWFFGVNIFDSDLLFQVNSVEQPIKRNSVGCGHMSHCWTSSFDDHLDESFVVFKKNCTTETHLEKNVFCWVRYPHITIAQTHAFSLLMEWSLVPQVC